MLSWLSIQGLALVERLELTLDPGLNVLTGETGAGKSLLVGSIGLLLGERADPDWLRAGATRGFVEGVFDLGGRDDLLEAIRALGVEPEEDRVILRRELAGEGKSRALVNGRTVTLSQLRAVGDLLVDLHGQHEHQLLLRNDRQTEFFDAWAGLGEERHALERERASLLGERRRLGDERSAWERDQASEARVREELEELKKAELTPGEEERLKAERERLRHRERVLESLRAARHTLAAEEGGTEAAVRRAAKTLRALAATVPDEIALADQAEALLDQVRLLTGALEDAEARALEDPLPLEELESRLDRIHRLTRKHRTDFDGLLALRDSLETRVAAMDPDQARSFESRERALAERSLEYASRLERLLKQREDQAPRFAREVGAKLGKLGFSKAALTVRPTEPASDTLPEVDLQFTPNPGEPARALRRIASGGELSRVMLAIKSLMAERDRVALLVFDEVDQGIGGAVGEEVGRMLHALAAKRQVLCITHLPLIAAHGTRHFVVAKSEANGRTATRVRAVDGKEREEEIARLLAGARVSDTTRRQARELLRA